MRRRAFGVTVIALVMLCSGCGDDTSPRYVVTGNVWLTAGGSYASFTVCEYSGGPKVYDAIVALDGEDCAVTMSGTYDLSPVAVVPGDDIVFDVSCGDFWATCIVTVPDAATVTGPTGTHDAADPITVAWTSPSPLSQEVRVSVTPGFTVSPDGWSVVVDGAQSSVDIPGGTLKPGTSGIDAAVTTINSTADLGPLAGNGSTVSAAYVVESPQFSTQ